MIEMEGTIVDATVCGCALRFGNHSCDPNAEYVQVELGNGKQVVFAVATEFIPEGTEVTFNYRLLCTGNEAGTGIACKCASRLCRGNIAST